MKNNFLSLLFGVLVLISLSATKSGEAPDTGIDSFAASLEATSLSAAEEASSRPNFAENYSQLALISPQKIISSPVRKNTFYDIPKLDVSEAAVFDLDSGIALFHYDGNRRWPTASIVKLLTAAVASEKMEPDREIAISARAVSAEGDAGGLAVGEKYKLADLIKVLLLVSSNDAAEAIAEAYGRDDFIIAMKEKIKELRMNESTVVDPAGLSVLNQSTPSDLKKLAEYIILNHGGLFELTRRPEAAITDLSSGKVKKLNNINVFAGQSDFLGGKTGYLDEAGGNLLSLFSVNGRRLLIVVFGADDRFKQTGILLDWIKKNHDF